MQLFAGFVEDYPMSYVFNDDVEDEEHFFEPLGDPIYDEELHDEEFNDESIFQKYNIKEPIFDYPIFEELIFDKDEEDTKISLSPIINQSDGGGTIFVDVSYLFEVELSILEFIKIVILYSHHLRMHRIRGRILSNTGRMMQGKLGYSFKNVEITETDKRVVFSEWNRPSKQDPRSGVSGFKPNSDV